ncbi:MAG: aminoglycoside phosphotransferase family protein [Spirochaetales bacterium]|nr:aminoglycoside phosphotransferase family protein [Spirochaetales bacterium]
MKSITKNQLTDQQIISLVKNAFGDDCKIGEITELKGGAFNSAYSIERLSENDKVVLKISTSPDTPVLSYEKDLMRREIFTCKHISKNTSLPVPEILYHDISREKISSDYFFMSCLEGFPMQDVKKKIPADNLVKLKEEMAGYFAQIHKIKGTTFGYMNGDGTALYANWKEAFSHMFKMILDDGRRLNRNLPYDRIEKALEEHSSILSGVTEPSLVDFDLWAGNIFLKETGGEYKITGIVDFERAFWGDPLADFPSAVMLLKDLDKEEDFWTAYTKAAERATERSKEEEARIVMYRMYLFTIMAVETYRYGKLYALLQKTFSVSVIKKCLKKLESF